MVVTLRPNASRPRACIDSDSAVSDTVPSFDMADRTRTGRVDEAKEEEERLETEKAAGSSVRQGLEQDRGAAW